MLSILIRSEERMLLDTLLDVLLDQFFQSSSAPKSGCYIIDTPRQIAATGLSILIRSEERMLPAVTITPTIAIISFNPHPLRRADATAHLLERAEVHDLSILIRSEERMLQYVQNAGDSDVDFQSSSAPKSGCYARSMPTVSAPGSFNPHPLRRADATRQLRQCAALLGDLSILIRSEERMLPRNRRRHDNRL